MGRDDQGGEETGADEYPVAGACFPSLSAEHREGNAQASSVQDEPPSIADQPMGMRIAEQQPADPGDEVVPQARVNEGEPDEVIDGDGDHTRDEATQGDPPDVSVLESERQHQDA